MDQSFPVIFFLFRKIPISAKIWIVCRGWNRPNWEICELLATFQVWWLYQFFRVWHVEKCSKLHSSEFNLLKLIFFRDLTVAVPEDMSSVNGRFFLGTLNLQMFALCSTDLPLVRFFSPESILFRQRIDYWEKNTCQKFIVWILLNRISSVATALVIVFPTKNCSRHNQCDWFETKACNCNNSDGIGNVVPSYCTCPRDRNRRPELFKQAISTRFFSHLTKICSEWSTGFVHDGESE